MNVPKFSATTSNPEWDVPPEIRELIHALEKCQRVYSAEEILEAKRRLPLPKLMGIMGDCISISMKPIARPLPHDFLLDRLENGRWVFVYQGVGDEIVYLKMRCGLERDAATKLLCLLADRLP